MFKDLKIYRAIENLMVVFSLLLANRRAFIFQDYYLATPLVFYPLWIELIFWVGIFGYVVWLITKQKHWHNFVNACLTNWFILPFLIIATVSIIWTIQIEVSLYRVLTLFFASFIAAYIGFTFDRERFFTLLTWSGVILIVLSFSLIIFLPEAGKMIFPPYYNAWRGVFWHRNQLGITMSLFAILFLINIIDKKTQSDKIIGLHVFFYIWTLLLIFFSRSLTGVLMFLVFHLCLVFWSLWVRFRPVLHPNHYRIFGFGILIMFLMGFLKIDQFAELLNKSASWSGRIVLWEFLLSVLVYQRPILGYGYGAIWNFHDFRINLGEVIGWNQPILIGDNGYIDIWLHLGSVGLVLFLGVIFMAGIRFLKYALEKRTLPSFLPLLLIIFLLIANISFSLFLELESFFWMVLIALLFGLPSKGQAKYVVLPK